MSSTIDTKVVEMRFDNDQFEKGVKETMSTLDKLKDKLKGMNASDTGLEQISKSAKNVDLSSLSNSVDQLSSRFSTMGIIGMTVIQNLTNSALNFAKKWVTAIPSQIANGGWTRAMNLEKAQFQLEGLGYTWDRVGKQISNAVNGTAYSLDAAAKAASQLAASGVEVKGEGDALEKALTAISGVAAQTNSDFESISHIFTTVAGNGKLMTEQLNMLSSRGMNAAATLGKVLNKSEAEIRDMVSKGKIDFQTFSDAMLEAFGEHAYKANETFDGALSNMKSALSKIGAHFAEPIIQNAVPVFNALRVSINGAKTQVEEFMAKFDLADRTMQKAEIGKVQKQMKELDEAYKSGTISLEEYEAKNKDLGDTLTFLQRKYVEAMSPFEKFVQLVRGFVVNCIEGVDWSFLEGVFKTFINLGKALFSVINPIYTAFKATFGNGIWKMLDNATMALAKWTSKLELSQTAMLDLRDTFRGLFSIVDLFCTVINAAISAIIPFEMRGHNLAETILNITGTIGRMITHLTDVKNRTDEIRVACDKWAKQLRVLAGVLAAFMFRNQIMEVVSFVTSLGLVVGKISLIAAAAGALYLAGKKIVSVMSEIKNGNTAVLGPFERALPVIEKGITAVQNKFNSLVKTLKELKNMNFSQVLESIKSGLDKIKEVIVSLFSGKEAESAKEMIRIADEDVPLAGSKLGKLGNVLTQVGNKISSFFKNLPIAQISAIAFTTAMTYMGIKVAQAIENFGKAAKNFGGLAGSMSKTLTQIREGGLKSLITGTGTLMKRKKTITTCILEIAAAVGVLAASLYALSTIPSDEIWGYVAALTALAGIASGMAIILAISTKIAGSGADMSKAALAILALSASVIVLVGALKMMEQLNMDTIWKNVAVLGTITGILVAAIVIISKLGTVASDAKLAMGALTIVACAVAVKKMAESLAMIAEIDITKLSWEKMSYFAATVGMLAVLAVACSKVAIGGFAGLLGCLIILKAASPIMEQIADFNYEAMADSFNRAVVAIGALGLIVAGAVIIGIAAAGKGVKEFGKGLLGLAASLAIMGVVVSRVGKLDKKTLIKGTVFMAAFMILVGFLEAITEQTKESRMVSFGVALMAMATTFSIMAVVAWRIGQLDKYTLIKGTAFVGALMVLTGALMRASKYTEKAKLGPMITLLIMMTTLLTTMIVLTLIDIPSLIASTLSMSVLMLALAAVIKSIGCIDGVHTIKKLAIMITITGLLLLVAESIARLSSCNWQSMLAGGAAMSLVILAMSKLFETLSASRGFTKKTVLGKIGALLAAAASLSLVALALRIAVVDQPWQTMLSAGVAMSAAILAIAGALKIISGTKVDGKTATGFLACSLALVPIGIALSIAVNGQPWQTMIAAGAAMSMALLAVAGAMTIISTIQQTISGTDLVAFGLIATALIPIAIALSIAINDQPWQTMIAGALAMSTCLIAIAGALAIVAATGGSVAGAAAIVVCAAALVELAYALNICNGVDWASVGQMCVMLGALTVALTAISFVGTVLGPGMIIASACMVALSASLIIFAGALSIMTGVDWSTVGQMCTMIGVMSVALIALAAAFTIFAPGAALVIPILLSLSVVILAISAAFVAFGAAAVMAGAAFATITASMMALQAVDLVTVASGILQVSLAVGSLVIQAPAILISATAILTLSVALAALGLAVTAATTSCLASIGTLTTSVTQTLTKCASATEDLGKNVVKGFVKGLTDQKELMAVKKAANALAKVVPEEMRTVLDIHSPSKVVELIGQFVTKGFQEGVLDKGIWNNIKSEVSKDIGSVVSKFGEGVSACKTLWNGLKNGEGVINSVKNAWSQYNTAVSDSNDSSMNLFDSVENLMSGIGDCTDLTGDYTDMLDSASAATSGLSSSTKEATDEFEKLRSTIESAIDPFKAFDYGDSEDAITSWEILSNMQSQIQGVSQWAQMLAELGSRGLSGQLLSYLSQLGPQGYQYVQAFYSMTSEQLALANERYSQILSLDENATATIKQGYKDAGYWSAAGFKTGITTGAVEAVRAAGEMGIATLDKVKEVLDIHSPSRKTHQIGEFLMLGLKNGMMDRKLEVFAQMGIIAGEIIRTAKDIVNYEAGYEIGDNYTMGFAAGIEANASAVVNAAAYICGLVIDTCAKELDERSPSKVANKLGRFFSEGLAIGIDDNADMVAESSKSMSGLAVDGIADAMRSIMDYIDADADFNPTIKPVLDLSDIQNGKTVLDGMLGSNYSVSAASGINSSLNAKAMATLDARNQILKTDNTDIVNAINGLQSNVNILGQRLDRMSVVLDSGTLVGGIVSQMDAALGARAVYAGRSN